MRKLIGISLIILGALLGLYLGLWQMFIGGILTIARAFDNEGLTATLIAWNLIKIILATPIGGLIFWVLATIGVIVIDE